MTAREHGLTVHLAVDELDSEVVAALTAVLFARAAAGGLEPSFRRPSARWSRPERTVGYCSPHSWR